MWNLWNLRTHNKRLLDQRGKPKQETTKSEEIFRRRQDERFRQEEKEC
jgi:hypothetical protein